MHTYQPKEERIGGTTVTVSQPSDILVWQCGLALTSCHQVAWCTTTLVHNDNKRLGLVTTDAASMHKVMTYKGKEHKKLQNNSRLNNPLATRHTPVDMASLIRAVAQLGQAYNISIIDVPAPTILNPTDAIVRINASAICGSDLHTYHVVTGSLDAPLLYGVKRSAT